mgnify:FL=1
MASSRSSRPTCPGLPLRKSAARTHSPESPQLCVPGSTNRRAFARFPFRGSAALSALLRASPFALTGCPFSDGVLTKRTAFPSSGFDPHDGLLLARRCRPISSDLHSQGSAPSEVFPRSGMHALSGLLPLSPFLPCLSTRPAASGACSEANPLAQRAAFAPRPSPDPLLAFLSDPSPLQFPASRWAVGSVRATATPDTPKSAFAASLRGCPLLGRFGA